tara:strand:+ start:2635 stop:3060 length:426 start_codon:yes stop_codon:yes gene_type:complete
MNQALSEAIKKQLSQVTQLLDMTEKTREALLARDMDTLHDLIQKEEELLNQIRKIDDTIAKLPDKSVLTEAPFKEDIVQIKGLLQRCQMLNSANQDFIDMSLGALNRLKKILITNRNQNSLTYTDKGQPHTIASSGESIEA